MIFVEKPWGYERWIAHKQEYVMKEIFIRKGHKTSLQMHNTKKETNYVFQGKVKLTLDDFETIASSGTVVDVEPGQVHRIEALEDTLLFEASTYNLSDVVRLEDDYNRENTNAKQ